MVRLEGEVAIITGSAQGMGEAHARMFIDDGAKVVITDLNEEKGSPLAEDVKAQVEEFAKTIPMKRIAKVEEVSKTVLFLASEDSSYSTG